MFVTLIRLFKTAKNHIQRNGWLSVGATAIMTLTFVVISIFLIVAYTASYVVNHFEQEYPLDIFFNPSNIDVNYIHQVENQLRATGDVKDIKYISQSQAYIDFTNKLKNSQQPSLAQGINQNILPPSIEIKANSLTQLQSLSKIVYNLKNTDKRIDNVIYFPDAVAALKQFINIVQIIGISLIIFLVVVSFIIVLITIGITINSHATEIEIMQLVGASRNYIRVPYILDGAFYGAVGAIISAIIIGITMFVLLKVYPSLITNAISFFQGTPLPNFGKRFILLSVGGEVLAGIILGGFGSVIALIKYLR